MFAMQIKKLNRRVVNNVRLSRNHVVEQLQTSAYVDPRLINTYPSKSWGPFESVSVTTSRSVANPGATGVGGSGIQNLLLQHGTASLLFNNTGIENIPQNLQARPQMIDYHVTSNPTIFTFSYK